ncbi:hypothetical protein [Butyrivibrio sp. VCD2006]|uniref:hypothetical protein n=1 Tax=Butyrivibrio sp. VCD2006 TaxID=1280664 RepID=UPI0004124C5F|nr:hypothetical protein [Butyrivibrio sp. VCD2006]
MKANVIKGIVTGVVAVMMIGSLTACGMTREVSSNLVVEASWDDSSDEEQAEYSEEEMMNLEEEINAVQESLIFMGGLKTTDDDFNEIDVAMFRNEDGEIVYIYEQDDTLDYGIYTTEYATTADGEEYAEIDGSIGKYGYYFNEDLVSGIIIDTDGNVHEAIELDEEGARDYVRKTLGA